LAVPSFVRFDLEPNQIASVLLALSCRRRDLHQWAMSEAQRDKRDRSESISLRRSRDLAPSSAKGYYATGKLSYWAIVA